MPGRRAGNVCEACHSHKVRCEARPGDGPCLRCAASGEECQIRVRKQYPARRKMRRPPVRTPGGSDMVLKKASSPAMLHANHAKIVAAAIPKPSARSTSIFVGNGGYGKILDAVSGDTPNRWFEVYATAERRLNADDLDYLNAKGCFMLPEQSEELLEAYFKFVHPTFPVIDGVALSHQLEAGGLQGVNLLLLWSMFSVSASYIPTLPRIACKESFVQRAKLLFDISPEHDKLVLVQSALLLSFWFADTEDVKQSWYWTSIAFGIAQSLGLHHEVEATAEQEEVQHRSWWRNIWQCCLIRDVWLAFGMGRPIRLITPNNSIRRLGKLSGRFADLTLHGKKLYSPDEAKAFESMWQDLVNTSTTLRNSLIGIKLTPLSFEILQDEIDDPEIGGSSHLITHAGRHLKLHKSAAAIALAQANNEQGQDGPKIAAGRSIAIIQAMLDDKTVEFASPVTIPLVTPAMVSCLNTIRHKDSDGDPGTQKLSNQKLDVISNFLTALEANYPAAAILKQVLETARHAVDNEASDQVT